MVLVLPGRESGWSQPLSARYYSIKQGLPAQALYGCVQDRRGFLWIATENGVARFDGFQFRHYGIADGLPDPDVLNVFMDGSGVVWALPFQKAPVYYNDSTDTFCSLPTLVNRQFRSYQGFVLSPAEIAISDIHGQIYVIRSSDRQITDSLNFHSLVNHVVKLDAHTYGVLLAQTYFIVRNHQIIKSESFQAPVRYSLYDPSVLYCGNNNDLQKINACTGKIFFHRKMPFAIRQLNRAPHGLYATTLEGDVYLLDTATLNVKKKIWHQASINDVYDPGKGLIWISTKEEGLVMLRQQVIQRVLQKQDNEPSNLNCVLVANRQLIAGNNHGELIMWDGTQAYHTALTARTNLDAWIRKIFYNPPNFLVVTQIGLFQFSPGKPPVQIFPVYYGFKKAARVNDSTYLLGTHGHLLLCQYRRGAYHLKLLYAGQRITAIAPVTENECYVGSHDGLYHFQQQQMHKVDLGGNIGQQKVSALAHDQRGWIWVAYAGDSLLAFDPGGVKLTMRISEHFPGDIIKCLYADGKQIWVGTNNSLGKISVYTNPTVHVQTTFFSTNDGLSGEQINDIEKAHGQIYVATSNGISYFPDNLSFPAADIPVYIMGIHTGKRYIAYASNQTPVLSYLENHIRFHLSAVDYSGLPGIWYRYRLNEHKWIITKDPVVSFYELPPGKYHFQVQAIRRDGMPSSQMAEASFEIRAPFFVKPFFWIMFISIAFVAAGISIWRYFRKKHQRRIKELEQQKKMIDLEMQMMRAQINPHFIFNTLNAIKQMIYDNDIRQANHYLDKFSDLLRTTLYTRQDAMIPLHQELEYLSQYLALEKLRFGDQFTYQVIAEDHVEMQDILIPAMILQPVAENAVKHGIRKLRHRKGIILIRISLQQQRCRIEIMDNGPGFTDELPTGGKGLEITRKRAEWHGIRFYMQRTIYYDQPCTVAVFEIPVLNLQPVCQTSAVTS